MIPPAVEAHCVLLHLQMQIYAPFLRRVLSAVLAENIDKGYAYVRALRKTDCVHRRSNSG